MEIKVKTKYNIGQSVYVFEEGHLFSSHHGYIRKVCITKIEITDKDGGYIYVTDARGPVAEEQLFEKQKDAKQYAKNKGCEDIKCIS